MSFGCFNFSFNVFFFSGKIGIKWFPSVGVARWSECNNPYSCLAWYLVQSKHSLNIINFYSYHHLAVPSTCIQQIFSEQILPGRHSSWVWESSVHKMDWMNIMDSSFFSGVYSFSISKSTRVFFSFERYSYWRFVVSLGRVVAENLEAITQIDSNRKWLIFTWEDVSLKNVHLHILFDSLRLSLVTIFSK